ncbi:MAG TPA: LamG-like jellyroll fold domain-containing protein, partial [Hymenobacter sp.]
MASLYSFFVSPSSHLLLRRFHLLIVFLLISISIHSATAQSLPGSGNALSFNGNNSYISCGTNNRGVRQQVTVEAWIKTTSKAYQFIVTKYLNSLLEEKGYILYISDGTAGFAGRVGAGQFMNSGPSTTRIDDGKWHHLAGVCNFSTWQIYVDGVLEKSVIYTVLTSDLTTTTALVIGSYRVQNDQYYGGE